MQKHGLNLLLNRSYGQVNIRKVVDLFHLRKLPAKTGIGIFSGTLLLGSGFVLATSKSNSTGTPVSSLPVAPSIQTETLPTVAKSVSEDSGSPGSHSSGGTADASEQSSSKNQANINSTRTEVIVNGQSIPVPINGSTNQIVTNHNGTTNVQVTTASSGHNSTTSHTNVQTNSFSSSNTNTTSVSSVHNN